MAFRVTSRPVASNDLVMGRPGTAVPAVIMVAAVDEESDISVVLRIRVEPGGFGRVVEMLATPLSAGGIQHDAVSNPPGALTARALRAIRADTLAREAIRQQERPAEGRPDIQPGAFQVPGDPGQRTWLGEPARPRRTRAELIAEAARIYNTAVRSGNQAPTLTVAAELRYSRMQASRFIKQAREEGRIPKGTDH